MGQNKQPSLLIDDWLSVKLGSCLLLKVGKGKEKDRPRPGKTTGVFHPSTLPVTELTELAGQVFQTLPSSTNHNNDTLPNSESVTNF